MPKLLVAVVATLALAGCLPLPMPPADSGDAGNIQGPANMQSYGIVFDGGEVVETPPAASAPVETVAAGANHLVLYVDFMCLHCDTFLTTNADALVALASGGEVAVELRPLAFLDSPANGNGSTAVANAVAAVADASPEHAYSFIEQVVSARLYEQQVTDSVLVELAAGVVTDETAMTDITDAIASHAFAPFITQATQWTLQHPGPDGETVGSTPSVFVNGVQYEGANDDPAAFEAFVDQEVD